MNTTNNVQPDSENNDFNGVKLFIQMEYCEGDTLEDFIQRPRKPDRNQNYAIMS